MNLATRTGWALGLLTLLASLTLDTTQAQDTPNGAGPVLNDPIEVLTRGPVHEAFAQPQDVGPDMGEIAPKEPPPTIAEQPPDQKPEADNAQWLPGYWAWDPARQDFTWVSGVYRVPPQNRQFVAGYWANTDEGWRWVPGYWANPNQPEQQYTPQPPAPLDDGPSLPAPDDNSTYLPGFWQYRNENFAWQPGYWSPLQSGRLWVGPRYEWTPRGYLFCNGYWDLPYHSRGLLFAPVAFHQPLWNNPNWSYQPGFVVGFGSFLDSAFCRTGGSHFYFGNYYGNNYAGLGYRPWYNGAGRYNPMFAHHQWSNNLGPNYVANTQRLYNDRNLGRASAPALSIAAQNRNAGGRNGHANVVTPIQQFTSVKLVQSNASQIDTHKAQVQLVRETSLNRSKLEKSGAGKGASTIKTPAILGNTGSPKLTDGGVVRSGNLAQKGVAAAKGDPTNLRNPGVNKFDGKTFQTPKLTEQPKIVNNPAPRVIEQPKIINNPAPKFNNPAPRIVNPRPVSPAPRIQSPPSRPAPVRSAPPAKGGGGAPRGGKR